MTCRGTFIHEEMGEFLRRIGKPNRDAHNVFSTFRWLYNTLLTITTSFTETVEVCEQCCPMPGFIVFYVVLSITTKLQTCMVKLAA